MIQSKFKYLFATSVKCLDYKTSPFVHELAETYPFRGRGFHTPIEWKIEYKVIYKQVIIQILIVNTTFYIYGNIRLKEISIMNAFEQIQENTISGSAFSARLGSSAVAFIIRPYPIYHLGTTTMRLERASGLFCETYRERSRSLSNNLWFSVETEMFF